MQLASPHVLTVIDEGSGFTAICSCGWTGSLCDEALSAGMEWSMNHMQLTGRATP